MKKTKLLLFLFLLCLSTTSIYGQTQKDIAVDWLTPQAGHDIYPGVQVDIQVSISNSGSVDIEPTDSIYMSIYMGGQNLFPGFYLVSRDAAAGTDVLSPGESMDVDFPISFGSINSSGTADLCAVIAMIEGTDTTTYQEVDFSNNQSCESMNFNTDPTSIDTPESLGLKLYPNPVSDWLTLEVNDDINLKIYDLSGRVVRTEFVARGSNGIDLTDLTPGVYIYEILNQENQSITTGRIVKE